MSARVGVDLGATAVRVAVVDGVDSDGFAQVSRIGLSPVKPGAIAGGKIRNPQLVSLALSRALKAAGVPRYGFVLGLSSPDAALSRVTLPNSIRANERSGALRSMGLQISPTVPLQDSAVSTQLIRTDQTGEGHLVDQVAVAAALQSEVDALLSVCKLAGVEPQSIDLAGAATMRGLVRCAPEAQEVASLVDIGASKIMVATRQGPHLRSIRTVPGGGDDITRAIIGVTGEEMEQAERRKAAMRLLTAPRSGIVDLSSSYIDEDDDSPVDAGQQTAVEEALTRSVEAIVDQIAQTIESDSANYGSYTQGISLCGGTALLRGLKERLNQRVGVPVQIGRPWAALQRNKRTQQYFTERGDDPRLMLSLTTAIGLALWKEPS